MMTDEQLARPFALSRARIGDQAGRANRVDRFSTGFLISNDRQGGVIFTGGTTHMQQNNNPIRLARDKRGITQITLSLWTKRGLSTIRNAERGIATKSTLSAIARALGVSIDTLTGRNEVRP